MQIKKFLFLLGFFCAPIILFGQQKKRKGVTMIQNSSVVREVSPLIGKNLIPERVRNEEINPRKTYGNKIVPNKGLPKGKDPLIGMQQQKRNLRASKAPELIFEANSGFVSPTDPTGAVGPNHYVSCKNSAFTIHDKNGNVLVPSTSLENIFPGESLGDPIVFYDHFADRFVITQFSDSPNGFLVAVSQGSDPVNDGWYTYRFNTGTFPDYTKFSVWSDGYYVTANKDQRSQQNSEVVYVLEREQMLKGAERAQMLGFPLPGARIGGFYSPASFNALGDVIPPPGEARILYYQDDDWQDVSQDALKLWSVNVDWVNPDSSFIIEAEELTVSNGDITPFDTTFDGGSFANLPQPGTDGLDIDVLQGAVMHATNYRRFCDYNSVVLNFAVDIDDRPDSDNISGIRWYELRQNGDGQPWRVFQEGTYVSPGGKSAWCGSMAMDAFGNIGMGYTTMGTTENGASSNSFASIQYTGRLADDPLGIMTFAEQTIATGTDVDRSDRNRYGDYAHLTIDPVDQQTFWHIAEYFESSGNNARDIVGVFKINDSNTTDVGVVRITEPDDDIFSNGETISVVLKNYGTVSQSNIPVLYSINGNTPVAETFVGSLSPGEEEIFTFSTRADLSMGEMSIITAETNLAGDTFIANDCASKEVKNLLAIDTGVIALDSPYDGGGLSTEEKLVIRIRNYGGTPQSDIPVFYTVNGEDRVDEVFEGSIPANSSATYEFQNAINLSEFGNYIFEIGTDLNTDQDTTNDIITRTLKKELCSPTSNCNQFGDGLTSFSLSNISNTGISCNSGYEDFTDQVINIDRNLGTYILTVQTGFAEGTAEQISLWIDFNDNTLFEEDELLLSNEVIEKDNTDQNFVIAIPNDVPLGTHLLRVRAGDTSTNNGARLNDACGSMQFGTTHDYTVEIGENTNPNADLIVVSQSNNQFLITMSDSNADNELRLSIFTITGQTIATNKITKDANGRFIYTIDMSYASSGIYFVRLGGEKTGKSAKFIVN